MYLPAFWLWRCPKETLLNQRCRLLCLQKVISSIWGTRPTKPVASSCARSSSRSLSLHRCFSLFFLRSYLAWSVLFLGWCMRRDLNGIWIVKTSTRWNPRVFSVFDSSSLLGLSERDPLLEKRYVHYIQSPTRGQEPLNDHLADGCGLKTELFRFPEMIRIRVQSPWPRALVFYFLIVKYFIHTILLQQGSKKKWPLNSTVTKTRSSI